MPSLLKAILGQDEPIEKIVYEPSRNLLFTKTKKYIEVSMCYIFEKYLVLTLHFDNKSGDRFKSYIDTSQLYLVDKSGGFHRGSRAELNFSAVSLRPSTFNVEYKRIHLPAVNAHTRIRTATET